MAVGLLLGNLLAAVFSSLCQLYLAIALRVERIAGCIFPIPNATTISFAFSLFTFSLPQCRTSRDRVDDVGIGGERIVRSLATLRH
ncbi:MAG: hypothetical protein HC856_00420 [Pseudanabaena sp. RU_4_16]|nr:hypothetical protein [Pseudanabaena sp. RU_4_16]